MNEEQKKLLSEIMRAKRKEHSLTQEQAAELLGVGEKWLQRVESGVSKPGFDLICALAKEFQIDFAQFADIKEKEA